MAPGRKIETGSSNLSELKIQKLELMKAESARICRQRNRKEGTIQKNKSRKLPKVIFISLVEYQSAQE